MGSISKYRFFVLVIALVLLITNVAAAQTPPPTPSPRPPQPEQGRADGSSVQPAAIPALGTAGLNYRYEKMYGETLKPYEADTTHLNRPYGITVDPQTNDLFFVEERGYRLLKFNAAKEVQFVIGIPGIPRNGDYSFDSMNDVALDSQKHIWVTDWARLVEYSPDGNYIRSLPESNSWESGSDNGRFNDVRGLAFDKLNHLFVADNNNRRVEVYTYNPVSDETPVYFTTIPFTGEVGRLAVDSANTLYVVQPDQGKVQQCTYVAASTSWNCSDFLTDISWPRGVAVDEQDRVFISTTGDNGNLYRCQLGACTVFASQIWQNDIAIDSSGKIYSADPYGCLVQTVSEAGLQEYLGVPQVPYLTNNRLYNRPRVDIDPQGNLIIIEENGNRLLKVKPDGTPLWSVGTAGLDVPWWEPNNNGFIYPHAVATDAQGNIYVGEDGRVRIFNSSGVRTEIFDGGGEFYSIYGVAIGQNGYLYLADQGRHRVRIYNASRQLVAQIGQTDVCGAGPNQLCGPSGLALDANNNLYIADTYNQRVLKFDANRVLKMTLGTTGETGNDFAHFLEPWDVVVDAYGRIFVADLWNNRIQVFDASGAYLTSIGGYGNRPGQMEGAMSVALDTQGNVYVSDWNNMRIMKFAPNMLGWKQTNINGFGDPDNSRVDFIGIHNDMLYAMAGVNGDYSIDGAQIWRTSDGKSWSKVATGGLGDPANTRFLNGVSFGGYLYTGSDNRTNGPGIWRCADCDGSDWEQVYSINVGDPDFSITEIIVAHENALYASVSGSNGLIILRSTTGDLNSWEQVNGAGFGNPKNTESYNLISNDSYLYVGTSQWKAWSEGTGMTGTEVWRCDKCDGSDWDKVNTGGFGDVNNMTNGITVFNGALYIGTVNLDSGTQVWRCTLCNGTDWEMVNVNGFGFYKNASVRFGSYEGKLYAFTGDNWMSPEARGLEIYTTADGANWVPNLVDGWGDPSNGGITTAFVFKGNLFAATDNYANGGEVWQMMRTLFLPVTMKK